MKALPDEFQSHGQPTSPVGPIVDTFSHPEFMFDAQLVQVDVEAAVVVGKEVLIAAIDVNAQVAVSFFPFTFGYIEGIIVPVMVG